jgi:hypothetical protein
MIKQAILSCAAAAATLFGLFGCGLNVKTDVNNALVGKVHCRTFAWAGSFRDDSPMRATLANPVNEARLRAAIASHLQGLGMQPVSSNPECLVGYGIGAHNVIEGGYPVGWPAGYGYWHGGWGGGWGYAWDPPYVYREGIVGVDLYEARSREALWHASVNQDLTGVTGPAAEKKINEAVNAIFSKFPR